MSNPAHGRTLVALTLVALAVVAYFTVATPPEARELIVWLSPEEANHVAAGKPRLLHFTADWCAPCQQMRRTTFRNRRLGSIVNERFVPIRYEQQGREPGAAMEEAARRHGVGSFPTLVAVDSAGRTLAKIVGFRDSSTLCEELERALGPSATRRIDWVRPDSPVLKERALPRLYLFGDRYGSPPAEALDKTFHDRGLTAEFCDRLFFVEVSSYRGQGLYSRFGVRAVPTLVLTDTDDHEIGRLVGSASVEEVRQLLASAPAAALAGAPSSQLQ
jgi:thioredoxin-related protein